MLPLIVAVASPAPSPRPSVRLAPALKIVRLDSVLINGILFKAVEITTDGTVWRNVAITVKPDQVARWSAQPVATKNAYAQQMIDLYRSGLKYNGNIKLTFIDEQEKTLDQFIWTPPSASPSP